MNSFKLYLLGGRVTGRKVRACNKSKNPPLDLHLMSNKIIQLSQYQAQGIILLFYREKHDLLDRQGLHLITLVPKFNTFSEYNTHQKVPRILIFFGKPFVAVCRYLQI